jgi:hypothetical protein
MNKGGIQKKTQNKTPKKFVVNKVIREKLGFPLQLVIVGRTRSGKSYLLRNHIIPSIIKDYDDVMIFSPTASLDRGWNDIKKRYKDKIVFFNEFDNEQILDLINGMGEVKEEGGNNKTLLIFDDITDRFNQSKTNYFSKLAIFARHYDISYILTSHKFNAMNRLIRNNATSKIFFKVNSIPEMKTITDENATADVSTDDLQGILERNTGDHNSLLIQNGPDDDDYYRITNKGKLVKLK